MARVIWRFGLLRDNRRGVTAVEYALMAGAIAVVLALAMVNLTGGIGTAFATVRAAFP